MSPRSLLRWLALVLAVIAGLILYIELQAGPSVPRRLMAGATASASVCLLLLGRRAADTLKWPAGRRLWRSGPLGRAWLNLRRGGGG